MKEYVVKQKILSYACSRPMEKIGYTKLILIANRKHLQFSIAMQNDKEKNNNSLQHLLIGKDLSYSFFPLFGGSSELTSNSVLQERLQKPSQFR